MGTRLVIDSNTVYEIDEDCLIGLNRKKNNTERPDNKENKSNKNKNDEYSLYMK